MHARMELTHMPLARACTRAHTCTYPHAQAHQLLAWGVWHACCVEGWHAQAANMVECGAQQLATTESPLLRQQRAPQPHVHSHLLDSCSSHASVLTLTFSSRHTLSPYSLNHHPRRAITMTIAGKDMVPGAHTRPPSIWRRSRRQSRRSSTNARGWRVGRAVKTRSFTMI